MVSQRYDPFPGAVRVRTMIDRLFDACLLPLGWYPREGTLPLDVSERDDVYVIKASLPGVKTEDIQLTMQGNTLTIQGEEVTEGKKQELDYVVKERHEGTYARSFTLAEPINADNAKATFTDGVLTVTVPKAESTTPKHIAVQQQSPSSTQQDGSAPITRSEGNNLAG